MMSARDYYHHITNRKKLIDCLRCGEKMQPSAMNKHMKTVHFINFKAVCVWCLNSILNVTFSSSVYEHRLQCFHRRYGECRGRLFKKIPYTSWKISPEQINGCILNSPVIDAWIKTVQYDYSHLQRFDCHAYQLNFNETYPTWLTDASDVDSDNLKYFYNNFPMDVQLTSFDPFLQRVYIYKKNLWWIHIILPLDLVQKFLYIYEQNSSNVYVVPHWCICEDSTTTISESRLLHLIIVIPQSVRDKVITELNTYMGCLIFERYIEIMDPNKYPTNLMDIITFVSTREMIKIPGHSANLIQRIYTDSCYRKVIIHRTIIPYATLFAMLYIPNGLRNYVVAHYGAENFWRLPMRKVNNKWEIEYKVISPIKQLIFPIIRTMQLCEVSTGSECTNFLFIGDRVFTSEVNFNLTDMNTYDWNYHQALHKNFLLDNTQGLVYKPDAKTQSIINAVQEAIQPLKTELLELNKINENLRSLLSK